MAISPENRDLFDIEMEFRALGDAEGLYLCARVRELEEEHEFVEEIAYKEANALDDGLTAVMGLVDDLYTYLENSETIEDEDFKKITDLLDQMRDCENDARK